MRGGRGRAGLARGRTPRGPRGLGEGSRGRPFRGGGGGCSLPGGRRGPLLCEGGGRACIARCRAMSIHGRAAWDYIPNPPRRSPFLGGLRGGGGGWRLSRAPTHAGGGVAGGSSVRLGRKYPVASPGPVGPFEEEPRIAGGDSAKFRERGAVWEEGEGSEHGRGVCRKRHTKNKVHGLHFSPYAGHIFNHSTPPSHLVNQPIHPCVEDSLLKRRTHTTRKCQLASSFSLFATGPLYTVRPRGRGHAAASDAQL